MNFNSLKDATSNQLDALNPKESLLNICKLLNNNAKNYNWVGFYIMNHDTQELHLGPFIGSETDHTVIPFGKGICGQVAVSGETYIAKDVGSEGNYIACSIDVKSEIVIPIYDENKLVAQLDIDSHVANNFGEEDQEFLINLCERIGQTIGSKLHYQLFFS